MCGVAGFVDFRRQADADALRSTVERMAATLRHRGPDDGGVWIDAASGIALGFRRLAILDLTPQGRQPMVSASGRYVIVFNGEIYNFQELRHELERLPPGTAPRFRGHSDTEVLLAAFEHWGVRGALARLNGMFAFALWDRDERILTLGRDRLGEKPLYYGWIGRVFVFASEVKAIRSHPEFRPEIDRDALTLYLRHSCIPAPFSIYKGIAKLPPATLLELRVEESSSPTLLPYWSAREIAEQGAADPLQGSPPEMIEELDRLLRDAVRLRMVADVPLGAFLSGGVDSSTVVSLMQAQSDRPVQTFTIAFAEEGYSEALNARAVAEHLHTDHVELLVTPAMARGVIPRLAATYDEPFADCSQIPTLLLSELARRKVTVSLSGDGGDETFGGYVRHLWVPKLWRSIRAVPRPARALAAAALSMVPPRQWEILWRNAEHVLPRSLRQRLVDDKLAKMVEVLPLRDPESMYLSLISTWQDPARVVRAGREPATTLTRRENWARLPDFTQQMMFLDMVSYLPDDILVKLDRASMAVGLEARLPILDHRVVELAWRVPMSYKIRGGAGKWLLRQVLARYVPPRLTERPKMGFNVPIGSWLKGPLREWAEWLLAANRLAEEGIFDPRGVGMKWREHLSGRRNRQFHLWNVLMFQAWLEESRTAVATIPERLDRMDSVVTKTSRAA